MNLDNLAIARLKRDIEKACQFASAEGSWWARSLTMAELKKPGRDFDLRDRKYADLLAERLAAWPLEGLESMQELAADRPAAGGKAARRLRERAKS
jgi:hypothetical protein